ncbi:MAG: late competence development ComFB family protein [Peptococcaceae bacterium]|jgi:competence protein ComFB|nr:late competence development ComFB family protein [Peptococcaceae bacterium]
MYHLKNHMEDLVREALFDYLKQYPLKCMCERCQADIMAYALNRLPAKYSVSQEGEVFTFLENRNLTNQTKILAEIANAIQKIGNSPSHPVTDDHQTP